MNLTQVGQTGCVNHHRKLRSFLRSFVQKAAQSTQSLRSSAPKHSVNRLSTEALRNILRNLPKFMPARFEGNASFSPGKKNLELRWGRGKFEVESGPLGRGPEICQHLTQQGASKGFHTLRSLGLDPIAGSSIHREKTSGRLYSPPRPLQCASSQLAPTPVSTNSGTSSSAA